MFGNNENVEPNNSSPYETTASLTAEPSKVGDRAPLLPPGMPVTSVTPSAHANHILSTWQINQGDTSLSNTYLGLWHDATHYLAEQERANQAIAAIAQQENALSDVVDMQEQKLHTLIQRYHKIAGDVQTKVQYRASLWRTHTDIAGCVTGQQQLRLAQLYEAIQQCGSELIETWQQLIALKRQTAEIINALPADDEQQAELDDLAELIDVGRLELQKVVELCQQQPVTERPALNLAPIAQPTPPPVPAPAPEPEPAPASTKHLLPPTPNDEWFSPEIEAFLARGGQFTYENAQALFSTVKFSP